MNKYRMQWTALVALATLVGLAFIQPQQIGVILLKVNIIAVAAWGGYLIDRELFPYSRPHEHLNSTLIQLRRAVIVGSAMVAAGIAL